MKDKGLIQVENGYAVRQVKAGQSVYVRIKADNYENSEYYYTTPQMLWSDKTYSFDIALPSQILEPQIKPQGVFNEEGAAVQTMAPGKKYYAKFNIESDSDYSNVLMHFRVGKETMMENDFMQIEDVETSGIIEQLRGVTFDSQKGYSYDSSNTTDGVAKWVNINWVDFGKGTREVKVWFRINRTAPPNQELQFFYKAKFDNTRKPPSTASQELYSETYPSIVYYAGTEAVCTGDFCANSEWLYSQKDQLYMDSPYSMKQVSDYSYHTTILNNSETTYGKSAKPIYLSMSILGDESDSRKIKIKEYEVKDAIGRLTGNTPIYSADNLEITSFEKNSVINTTLKLEGIESGAEVIHFELKSEGKIIYTKEVPISVVKEKDFKVVISPQFVPAMINTDIEATVNTEKDDPLPGATINLYIKEPGFDQYQLDSAQTDRMGRAIVKTGAHLQKAKVIIEIIKEGYSRQMFSTTVSEQLVTVSPEEIISELNTFTKREETKTLTFTNLAKVPLVIRKISFDSKFKDLINEDALQGYFNELSLEERTIKGEDYVDIPLMRIRLANAITEDNFIEPVDLKGTVKIIFEEPVSQLLYDVTLPLTVRVSSSANLESECLVIKPTSKTTMNTEKAQVQFDFEMINACSTDGVGIPLDALTVNSSSDVPGIAEISIRNTTGTSLGITAIDGAKRQLIDHIRAGEKMFGTITFAPGQEAIGKSVTLQVGYEAKFKGQTVKSSPSMIEYTVNVVNLKECMQITADSAPVPFNEKSTIRIDTTGCLGEMIDVILCKEDSGCSGGTDGKVTLSTKAFTIQNKAQEIQVYNPTYPGTYGVTIHARARGTAGFTYIGEIPTSFLERDSQYFNLNKFELNLVGNGSKDTALLTNKMVSERINVKANECIWGKKDSGFNWSQAMTFGMIGAMLGNMIGSIYNPNSGSSSSSNKSNNTKNPPTMSIAEKAKFDEQYGTTKIESNDFMSGNTATYYMGGTASQKISSGGMDTILTTQSRFDPAANQWLFQVDQTGGPTTVYPISAVGGTIDGTMLNTAINNASTDVANWQTTNGSSFRSNLAKVFGAGYSGGYNVLLNGVQGTSLSGANTSATIPAFKSTATYTPQNQNNINLNNASSPSISPFPSGNSTTNPKDWAPYVTHAPYDQIPLQAAHFAAVGAGGTNYFQLGLTVIGAVAGMLIGGYFNQYKCDEHYAVVPFDDFVILLQGTTINVISPSGASSGPNTNLKEISPDAGAVLFTLGGVSPAWDFTDAQFAADETVGVTFQNTGLNDTRPTYGILTLNAKLHEHGKVIHIPNSGTISSSEYDYDVFCQNGNFGKYWIGPDNNAGNCGGVVEKLYQQKYHLRIISAEPKDEESYIKKATTCYMGALTGATGPDALPKIKLNWSWSKINENDCDYLNPDHVYCDAAQFTIALTKKLATLDDFLAANGSNFNCPPDMIEQEVTDSIDAINSQPVYIVGGFIGVKDITISTNTTTDITKAIVKIENNSGAVQNSFMNIALKGYGDPVTQLKQWDVPTGTSTQEFELTTPEYDGIYYFTAVVNGTAGNSLPVSRAFVNRDHNASCWVPKTTQQIGGLPGIFYYVAGMDNPTFTQKIKNPQDLYNYINFGVYLTKDGFSEDFFKDFKEYYSKELLQIASPTERKIVDYLTSGKFRIIKKFSGDNTVEPGLYDVWVRLNAEDKFRIIDANNTTLDITLLLVKSPGVNSPFYSMPFDGLLGERGGRQGYGTAYKSGDVRSDAPITISNNDFKVYTFFDSASNPITSVTTKTTSTFEGVNSSVSTRGQLGTVSVLGGGQSILALTPNYATPIIMKYTLSGTSGNMAFGIENTSRAVATRGNVAYWTGAAKSKDFYGANAVESYYNTPDYRLSKMGEGIYGFEFNDASRKGNLYLKSILFTPIDGAAYLFATKEDNTQVWTPNTPFGTNAELDGIAGMEYNYKSSSIQSLQELFDAVSQGSVCLTNDGSTTSFWWNPAVLETESGQINSIAKQELALVGK
ncbi:MAG: hypothetical protein NTY48_04825 [Candidatus Diapherotrites archaeon]|nr:hypothetical protein [Candidatus Diapherotrites archaeon]